MHGPGIESQWVRGLSHPSRPALVPPSPLYNGKRVSSPDIKPPGVAFTTHPNLSPRLERSTAIHIIFLWVFVVRSSVNFTLPSSISYKIHTSKFIQILATVLKSVSTQSPLPCSSPGVMSLVILCFILKCFPVLSGYVTFLKHLSQMGEIILLFRK